MDSKVKTALAHRLAESFGVSESDFEKLLQNEDDRIAIEEFLQGGTTHPPRAKQCI